MIRKVMLTAALAGSLSASAPQNPTFSSRVDVVRADALVTDAIGLPIGGLNAADFEVLDNGVAQHVDLVLAQSVPLNVVLTLDVSGSVAGEEETQLRTASRAVLDNLKSGDKAGLVTFGASVLVRARLTSDLAAVRSALEQQAAGAGDTSLVDASYTSMLLAEAADARGLVIVFSDGDDTGSVLTDRSVLETAKRMDAVVYAAWAGGSSLNPFLRDLSSATAGRTLKVESTDKLRETFVAILDEFRQRYLISYTPRGVAKGGWHTLTVRVKTRRATVRARPGYLAGS
jgi:VWFA-related protein